MNKIIIKKVVPEIGWNNATLGYPINGNIGEQPKMEIKAQRALGWERPQKQKIEIKRWWNSGSVTLPNRFFSNCIASRVTEFNKG